MHRLSRAVTTGPRCLLPAFLLAVILLGFVGSTAADKLLAGGYEDPASGSARATHILNGTFDRDGVSMVFKLDIDGTDIAVDPAAERVGRDLIRQLEQIDHVQRPIVSIWTDPTAAASLVSADGSSTLVLLSLSGGESLAPQYGNELQQRYSGTRDGVRVEATGQAIVYDDVNTQTAKDLLIAEAVALPISFLVLIIVFGGAVAASLPVAVGIFSIIGTLALLRAIAQFTDVSIFAMNLATALGLALAIDYTLLLLTRYREELREGWSRPEAIERTLDTAGRTIMFSALTVGASLSALLLFPMYFLRSFAYAGFGVVVVALVGSLVLAPALLMVIGGRIDALDLRKALPKLLGRERVQPKPVRKGHGYRLVQVVFRHAAAVTAGGTLILLLLGAPFLSAQLGFVDDRVLPASAQSRSSMDEIREQFDLEFGAGITVVTTGFSAAAVADYAARLSQVVAVDAVVAPDSTFISGVVAGPGAPGTVVADQRVLTVRTGVDPHSEDGRTQLAALQNVEVPSGATALFTGEVAQSSDSVDSIFAYLPFVLLWIAVTTFVLLFLFTGSVVLPIKSLIMNTLSLSATFGAMVWIFQDGHLSGLGTTATGYLIATMPILMFCVAFGLSMDYEVFILGRIREEWEGSDKSAAANEEAVALGVANTARVVTAAAMLMAIVFGSMALSGVSFMRMFGFGLALAVLIDATLVRMLILPAFMRLAGRANWWAPAPLRRFHDRFGLSEGKVPARVGE